jgi:hypothetical protein
MIAWLLLLACADKGDDTDPAGASDSAAADTAPPPDPLAPVALTGPGVRALTGERVVLDGSASYDPDDPYAELAYSWTVIDRPQDAAYSFSWPDSATPEFRSEDPGLYTLSLVVTDEDGLSSEAPATALIEVVPAEDLIVSLAWEREGVDLDLHLVAPGGDYWGEGDCFFGNPAPEWGDPDDATDNPTLSGDDNSNGPETVTLEHPAAGVYTVYVHYYDRPEGVTGEPGATVTVVAGDEIIGTSTAPNLPVGRVWKAGTLDWGALTFEVSDEVLYHSDLGGPEYGLD